MTQKNLQIGNIKFTTVSSFNVVTQNITSTYMPLRGDSIILPSGNSNTSFVLRLEFASLSEIYNELIPLISMFKCSPIITFEFEPIRVQMGVTGPMMCGLKTLEVSTVYDSTNHLRANLELVWCNWKALTKSVSLDIDTLTYYVENFQKNGLNITKDTGDLYINHAMAGDFILLHDDKNLVLSTVSFAIENYFVSIPIMGQVYPRLQHLGGSRIRGTIVLYSPGPDHSKLKELSAYFEYASSLLIKDRTISKSENKRHDLLSLNIKNSLLNNCGIKSVIISDSTTSPIPDTNDGLEHIISFYDISILDKYKNVKRSFTITNEKMLEVAGKIAKKYNLDPTYKNYLLFAKNGLYKDVADVLEDHEYAANNYIDPDSDLDQIFGHLRNDSISKHFIYDEEWIEANNEMMLAHQTAVAKALLENNAFLETDLGKELKAARENAKSDSENTSYSDLGLSYNQEPYNIFIEQHEIDYNGIKNKTSNEILEHLGKTSDREDVKNKVEGVRQDVKEYLKYELNTNRLSELYPTLKLYIVIEGNYYDKKRSDAFYAVETIDDIMLIDSKDLPAATLVATIHNLWGELATNQDDIKKIEKESAVNPNLAFAGTDKEFNISRLFLRTGMKVQLRYGYTNNAENLEVIFNGRITNVETKGTKIVITAQDAGLSLTNRLGEIPVIVRASMEKDNKVRLHTTNPEDEELIEKIMEGLEKAGTRGDLLAYFYIIYSGSEEFVYPTISDWFSPLKYLFQGRLDTMVLPDDDKILLKDSVRQNVSLPQYVPILKKAKVPPDLIGIIHNKSSWELLTELVYLYPGVVFSRRPYGSDITLYIANPDEIPIRLSNAGEHNTLFTNMNATKYRKIVDETGFDIEADWKRFIDEQDLSWTKKIKLKIFGSVEFNNTKFFASDFKKALIEGPLRLAEALPNPLAIFGISGETSHPSNMADYNSIKYDEVYAYLRRKYIKELKIKLDNMANIKSDYSSFRRLHYADSDYNLIFNNIKENSDAFNAVSVNWVSSKTTNGAPMFDPDSQVLIHVPGVRAKDLKIQPYQPLNVFNREMATRLGISLLMKNCNYHYDGEFGMLSSRHIRPYDYIYINDKTNKISGPVEVRDSILYANKRNGVTYVIIPDMVTNYSVKPKDDLLTDYFFDPVFDILDSMPFIKYPTYLIAPELLMFRLYVSGIHYAFDLFDENIQIYSIPLMKNVSENKSIPMWGGEGYFKNANIINNITNWAGNKWDDYKKYIEDTARGFAVWFNEEY